MPRVFNAAAMLRKEGMESKEHAKQLKAHHQSSFRLDILSRYSSDGDALNADGVKKWLAALSPDGCVSDDELRWIVMLGNIHSKNEKRFQGCTKDLDITSAVVFPDTFDLIVQAWVSYGKNKPSIESIFKQFDVDRNGSLSRGEVVDFLTSLNDGTPPTPEEVDWVFKSSDVIGTEEGIETPEVLQLLSAWYNRPSPLPTDDASGNSGAKNQVAAVAPNQVCGQCVLQ
jgi:Ca2+-binding EF-hand superfamily protein